MEPQAGPPDPPSPFPLVVESPPLGWTRPAPWWWTRSPWDSAGPNHFDSIPPAYLNGPFCLKIARPSGQGEHSLRQLLQRHRATEANNEATNRQQFHQPKYHVLIESIPQHVEQQLDRLARCFFTSYGGCDANDVPNIYMIIFVDNSTQYCGNSLSLKTTLKNNV